MNNARNTDERAIVRLRIPMKTIEVEESQIDHETGEEIKYFVTKVVEQEIDDRALLISARVDAVPFAIYVMNQAVPR